MMDSKVITYGKYHIEIIKVSGNRCIMDVKSNGLWYRSLIKFDEYPLNLKTLYHFLNKGIDWIEDENREYL